MMPSAEPSRAAGIQNKLLRSLLAYWQSTLKGRAMPRRADIDPVEIAPGVLPHVMLTDVLEGPRFRFRLVGTGFRAVTGVELTGRYLDELFLGRYGDYLEGLYLDLLRIRRPIYSESLHVSPPGRVEHFTQRLMLPLSEDGATVNMVLGGQVFENPHAGGRAVSSAGEDFEEALRLIL